MSRSGIAGSYGAFIPSFKGISTLFSIVAVLVCIPTNSVRSFTFLHTVSRCIVCRLFDDNHSDQCELISHSFDLHFLSTKELLLLNCVVEEDS